MSKAKKTPVDRAVARIQKPKSTDAQKVNVTRSTLHGMQNSPNWAAATDLQAAVKPWSATADAMEANATVIANLRKQVAAAEAKQLTLRRDWHVETTHVLSVATLFCGGSADTVKSFTLDVASHGRIGLLDVPADLAVHPGKVGGEVDGSWSRGNARHGFLVQHATDPANPATVSAPTACTKSTFKLGGLPSGASVSVSVRVAAIDPASPTGQTPWSAWVLGSAK
jgi:hypothetical protein